jgi:hypothetical protein
MIQGSIPLSEAAFQLHLTYHQALKRLMTGALNGERRDGRWYVSAASIEHAKQQAASVTQAVA